MNREEILYDEDGIPKESAVKYYLLKTVEEFPFELEDTILDKAQAQLGSNLTKAKQRFLLRDARNYFNEMVQSGLIIKAQNNEYSLSDAGENSLKIHSNEKKKGAQRKKETDKANIRRKKDYSEEDVKKWFIRQKHLLKKKLLEKMYNVDPYHFEHMMLELLNVMGYKGTNGESLVTQKSNDNGIDGIINQDPLGMQSLYVQVKRYGKDNKIDRPEIDRFGGALKRQGIDRGVFITTSSFTQGAKEAAKSLHISLVDGEMLTNLMIQYQVGVYPKDTQTLYQIDNDFFIPDSLK